MKRLVFSMISLGLLSAWFAFSSPAVELKPTETVDLRLPSKLLESRLSLCALSAVQKRGCEAAFKYLEDIARPARSPSSKSSDANFSTDFLRLRSELRSSKIPESEWVTGAFNAWLAAIDPHAKLVSAEDADRKASVEKILVQGAGAKLRFHHGKVYVGYSMEGSAAEATGLRPGDRLLSLNGRALDDMNETARRSWLARTVSPYKIRIEREGKVRTLEITEKRYYLANVEAHLEIAEDGRKEGHLRVRSFDKETTCADLRHAILNMEARGASRLRLNLNDNPGGLVREAQCAAGLFLGKGKVFARLQKLQNAEATQLIPASPAGSSYGDDDETLLLTEGRSGTRLPLVVEINQNSASAAEMLAAALQDNKRARVRGARSFGKGSMQSVFHPWNDEKLYLTRTTHAIYRPSGKSLQFNGVLPDEASGAQEGENFPRERELTL